MYACLLLAFPAACWSRRPKVIRGTLVHMCGMDKLEVLPDHLIGFDRRYGNVSKSNKAFLGYYFFLYSLIILFLYIFYSIYFIL